MKKFVYILTLLVGFNFNVFSGPASENSTQPVVPAVRSAHGMVPEELVSTIQDNFGVQPLPPDVSVPAEIPGVETLTPQPSFSKTDFSGIYDYYFGYINEMIVKAIDASQKSFEGAVYSITMKDIPDALIKAKERGIKVRLIIDEAHIYPRMDAQIKKLVEAGIDLRSLRGTRTYGVMHNKITIHDGELVTVGSYNWTFGATFSNYENTVVLRHSIYVNGYNKYWDWMWSKARKLSDGPSPEVPEGHYGTPPQDTKPAMSLNGTPVPAYLFSPGSKSQERLAQIIDSAKGSVDALTYTFSSKALADAIINAKKRGLKVRFLIDKNRGKESVMTKYLFDNGVEMRWGIGRNGKGALHSKFAILDGGLLETGSFNWTENASINSFENMVFVNDPKVLKAYQTKYDTLFTGAEIPTAADFTIEPAE